MDVCELIRMARNVRVNAYAPYSHFAVGAALEAADGRVFCGCNVENAAYSPSNCAERSALFAAVSQGVRKFSRIAIVGGEMGKAPQKPCAPCGVCRQCLLEFCDPEEFQVILAVDEKHYNTYSLGELLPLSFSQDNLK